MRAEVGELIGAIAKKVITLDDAKEQIDIRKERIARLEERLRQPKPVAPSREKLRAALEQKVADWKAILRGEPGVARVVLKDLITPITFVAEDHVMPAWMLPGTAGSPEREAFNRPRKVPSYVKGKGRTIADQFREFRSEFQLAEVRNTDRLIKYYEENGGPEDDVVGANLVYWVAEAKPNALLSGLVPLTVPRR